MRLARLAFVLGLVALVGSVATAQQRQPGGRGGAGFGLTAWLKNDAFVKELDLSKEQVEKATEALTKVQEDLRDQRPQFQRGGGFNEEAMREFQAKMTEYQKKVNEANTKALSGILKPEQVKRLKEIQLQVRLAPTGMGGFGFGGGGALAVYNDPEIQSALKLTDDQKTKIKDISEELGKEMRGIFQPGGDFQEARKKMEGLTKEATANVNKVLTSEQKKTFEEMKGKEFDVSKLMPQGGPGGRRGPGGEKKKVDF